MSSTSGVEPFGCTSTCQSTATAPAARAVMALWAAARKLPRQASNATAAATPVAVPRSRPGRRRIRPSVHVAIMARSVPASRGVEVAVAHRPVFGEPCGHQWVVGGNHQTAPMMVAVSSSAVMTRSAFELIELPGGLVGEDQRWTGRDDPRDGDSL